MDKLNEIGTDMGKERLSRLKVQHQRSHQSGWTMPKTICLGCHWAKIGYHEGGSPRDKNATRGVEQMGSKKTRWESCIPNNPHLTQPLDIEDFGIAFVKWWHRMQPSFRHSDDLLPAEVYTPADGNNDDVWARLRKGGPNGLVCILTMLGWWGRGGSADPNWKAAAIDIRRTLEHMMTVGTKRMGEDSEQDGVRKRKK
ncbi:hypothetical protein BD779DRAFT_1678122 [Infundibulicybe gibba]|nr:hypothetical protein BD779DRAFT_1678122 [Infundibulicybe gibba]